MSWHCFKLKVNITRCITKYSLPVMFLSNQQTSFTCILLANIYSTKCNKHTKNTMLSSLWAWKISSFLKPCQALRLQQTLAPIPHHCQISCLMNCTISSVKPDECFIFCSNLNILSVVQQGFNLNTMKAKEYFYNAQIRINKQRVGLLSQKVLKDDLVDIILKITDKEVTLRRILINSIKKTTENKTKIYQLEVSIWDSFTVTRL